MPNNVTSRANPFLNCRRFLNCLRDDSGQAMTEYALLTSGVVLASVFFVRLDVWRTPISDFMFEMILNVAVPFP